MASAVPISIWGLPGWQSNSPGWQHPYPGWQPRYPGWQPQYPGRQPQHPGWPPHPPGTQAQPVQPPVPHPQRPEAKYSYDVRPPVEGELEESFLSRDSVLFGWYPIGQAPQALGICPNKAAQECMRNGRRLSGTVFSIGAFRIAAAELPSNSRCAHINTTGHCTHGDCYFQHGVISQNSPKAVWLCANAFCGGHAWFAGPACFGEPRFQLRSVVTKAKAVVEQDVKEAIHNIPCYQALEWTKIEAQAREDPVPIIADFEAAVVGLEDMSKWCSRGIGPKAQGIPDEDGTRAFMPSEATMKGFNFSEGRAPPNAAQANDHPVERVAPATAVTPPTAPILRAPPARFPWVPPEQLRELQASARASFGGANPSESQLIERMYTILMRNLPSPPVIPPAPVDPYPPTNRVGAVFGGMGGFGHPGAPAIGVYGYQPDYMDKAKKQKNSRTVRDDTRKTTITRRFSSTPSEKKQPSSLALSESNLRQLENLTFHELEELELGHQDSEKNKLVGVESRRSRRTHASTGTSNRRHHSAPGEYRHFSRHNGKSRRYSDYRELHDHPEGVTTDEFNHLDEFNHCEEFTEYSTEISTVDDIDHGEEAAKNHRRRSRQPFPKKNSMLVRLAKKLV